jgi:hypothetical protein
MASYKEGQKFPHCGEGEPSILTGQIVFPTLVGVDSLAKTAIDSTCSKGNVSLSRLSS